MKEHYINAVVSLLHAETSVTEVIAGLDRVLAARGHEKLRPGIVRGVMRVLSAQRPSTSATVITASETSRKALASEIAAALSELGATDTPEVIIDDAIIGGFIAKTNTKTYDASHRRHLVELYRTITN